MARHEIENLRDRFGNKIEFKDKELREKVDTLNATATAAVEAAQEALQYKIDADAAAETAVQAAGNAETSKSDTLAAAERAEEALEQIEEITDYAGYTARVQQMIDAQNTNIANNNTAQLAVIDQQTTSKVADQVSQMQVKEGQTVVDSTLTVSGAAAEAAKVGTEISQLKNEIYDETITPEITWQIGGITSTGTVNSTFKYCIRPASRAYQTPVSGTIGCDSGYQIRVVKYSTGIMMPANFVSDSGWTTTPISVLAGEFIAPTIRYENDTTTVLEDTSISEHIVYNLQQTKFVALDDEIVSLNTAVDENTTAIDEINDILQYNDIPSLTWKIGGINSNGALNNSVDWCIRSSASPSLDRAVALGVSGTIGCDEGYQIRIARYSSEIPGSTTFVSDTGWTSDAQSVTADELLLILIRKYPTETLEDISISSHIVWNLYTSWLVNYAASPYYRDIDSKKADFSDWYETSQTFTEGFDRDTTYAEIIAAFDALVSSSGGYLTKSDLGGIGATDLGGTEYHLYEYTFAAKKYNYGEKIAPVFLLNCTAHGFEKNAAYATYYLIKDLLQNWEDSEALTALRSNVIIKFIPVQNPWGFDRNDRLNENAVNLNRNYWNPQWASGESGTSDYGGVEPFDQPEAAKTRDWILSNRNAFAVFDVHTNGQYNSPEYSGINPFMPVSGLDDAYYNRIFDAGKRIIERQTVRLPGEITELASIPYNQYIGRIQADPHTQTRGTLNLWATLQNFVAITEELNQGVAISEVTIIEKFTSSAFKAATEVLGNCIMSFLAEYGN